MIASGTSRGNDVINELRLCFPLEFTNRLSIEKDNVLTTVTLESDEIRPPSLEKNTFIMNDTL